MSGVSSLVFLKPEASSPKEAHKMFTCVAEKLHAAFAKAKLSRAEPTEITKLLCLKNMEAVGKE